MPAPPKVESGPNKMVIVAVILVVALAAAVFSITRTVTAGQGKAVGHLGGIVGKAEAMKGQQASPQGTAQPAPDSLSGAPPGQGE